MGRDQLLPDVSRETVLTLERYVSLVQKWNTTINLVAPSTLPVIWERHINDSARVSALAEGTVRTWVDLGSGAGFPGIVVSILRPDTEVVLIESDQRKVQFLRTVRRELGLNARIVSQRIEVTSPVGASVVSARALAPLPLLLDYASRHGGEDAVYLFPKGATWASEIEIAEADWLFDVEAADAQRESDGKILKLRNLRRRYG